MFDFVHTPIRYNLSFFVTHDDIRYNHDTMLFLRCIAAPCEQGWHFLRKRKPLSKKSCAALFSGALRREREAPPPFSGVY
jgi:hypothetical protein